MTILRSPLSVVVLVASSLIVVAGASQQPDPPFPSSQLAFGGFLVRFGPDRTFVLEGQGWPTFKGTWKRDGAHVELKTPGLPDGCDGPGRYDVRIEGTHVSFSVVADACEPRRMILDRSTWRPVDEKPIIPERRIVRTRGGAFACTAGRVGRDRAAGRRSAGRRRPALPTDQHLPDRLGRQERRERPLANADPRPRALEPDRVGRSDLRDERRQQRRRTRRSGPASTATATRRTIDRAQRWMIVRDRQAHGQDRLGARGLRRGADRQAAHQVDLRERHARHRRPHRRRLVRFAGRPRLRRQRHTSSGRSTSDA